MRRLATLAVVAALISPTVASGQYTFGDWASDQGYGPGAVMPSTVSASHSSPAINSLNGIAQFDWTTRPTTTLRLNSNQLSSLESGGFSGLTNLTELWLSGNQLSSIESGGFDGLTSLGRLWLSRNQLSSIESGDFSGLTNLTSLDLRYNQISSIEADDFSGLTNLTGLNLGNSQISSIEADTFSGLTKLEELRLDGNQLLSIESGAFSGLTNLTYLDLYGISTRTKLNLEAANFSSLTTFDIGDLDVDDNVNITSISLKNAVVNQTSLARLLDGGERLGAFWWGPALGIGELNGTTEMDLSGIDFVDITDLSPLNVMDDLTDLWLVNTQNVDATALDVLLDNLATIEGAETEGILYMTQADFDAFNVAGGGLLAAWDAEPGHHVAFVIPEPSTLLLALVALCMVGGWRKWRG